MSPAERAALNALLEIVVRNCHADEAEKLRACVAAIRIEDDAMDRIRTAARS